ncbi:hypothetical protein [Gordonia alkaliphila]|uniref:DUF1214 domain-containing protein n=1 Tax=Gordonia alkaliphila TaxID=1053547 RepID=A0ABP8YW99_9ACTN
MALDDVTAPLRDAIAAAERQIAAAEFIDSDADLAEGYDYLAGSIAAVLQQSRTHDKVHPVLHTSTGPYTKMGLDNPDTLYYHADVVPEGTYRIRGIRGTTVDLSFQVLRGDYTPSEVPGGDDAFDDRRLTIADDGSYELTFGPPIDDAPSNYFVLGDGASMLAIREVYGDWIAEHKGSVTVERLDTRDEPARPLDSARAARQYATAAKLLTSRIHTWFNFPKWFYLDEPVNTLTVPRPTPGGLSTQFSSVGHYDLAPDQAMLITVPVSDSPYQGFQLGSLWYISLDYVHHQTSLNTVQAQHDPDGMIRMVIAHRDPGVTNWVETTGRRRGILQFRWQRSDAPIDGSLGPTCEVVDLAQVPGLLPYYDHNRIDADGWAERITARRRGFAERMLG